MHKNDQAIAWEDEVRLTWKMLAMDAVEVAGGVNGAAIFSPAIARRLMGFFTAPRPVLPRLFPQLTEREGEILTLIAQGLSSTEIADRLFVSLKTVRNHVSNIFSKLQVTDRAQAALRAREVGLGADDR